MNETPRETEVSPAVHEVVICGGGLAGLTLALQLRRRLPSVDVVVLERQASPLPALAHKIGESTVVGGADYLHHELDLFAYLAHNHVQKLGLRFFMGDPKGRFVDRPEMGRSIFRPEIHEWQFDRGALEDELRARVRAAGVSLREGWKIVDIELEVGDAPHRVLASDGEREVALRARWVVDATGRRRLLQRKLGVFESVESDFSSSWLRVPAKLDVSDLVPSDDRAWHARVPGGYRVSSTQHLVGPGYWLWMIPLPGSATSIGLVTSESAHAFETFNTSPRLLAWLREHEPAVHGMLAGLESFGFGVMRHYTSFAPTQVVSEDRWACTGEAACVVDPLYSAAMSGIGTLNTMICELVELDRGQGMTPELCARVDAEFTGWAKWIAPAVQRTYKHFGNTLVATCKVLWDFTYVAGLGTPNLISRVFRRGFLSDPELLDAPQHAGLSRYRDLYDTMMELFDAWGASSRRSDAETYAWLDYLDLPYLRRILMLSHTQTDDLVGLWQAHTAIVEEVAEAMFLLAVEDLDPSELSRLSTRGQLDPWSLSLDPASWQDGSPMFEGRAERVPVSARPPEWQDIHAQLRGLFRFTGEQESC